MVAQRKHPLDTPCLGRWQQFRSRDGNEYAASSEHYRASVFRLDGKGSWRIRVGRKEAHDGRGQNPVLLMEGFITASNARTHADRWIAEREYSRTLLTALGKAMGEEQSTLSIVWTQVELHRAAVGAYLCDLIDGKDR